MSRTEIVLAVVQCGTQICLARRSRAVATSQGLWSVVTAYVEPDTSPETQAWTEVNEELSRFYSPGVQLVRRLDPVALTSPSSGKEFCVAWQSALVRALLLSSQRE